MKIPFLSFISISLLLVLLFIIDICSFFWYHATISYLLLSLLMVTCWYRFNPILLAFGALLLASQALVIDQGMLIPLALQLAILLLLAICRERFYLTGAIPPLAFILYLGVIYPFKPYTMGTLFVNLIAIGLFSLKLKTSKTRQSLAPTA